MNIARLLTVVDGGGAAVPSPLLTDLVAYWNLDESSNGSGAVARVDSVAGLSLTDNNTTPSGTGILSNCAQLNNSNNESLSITDNPTLSMGDVACVFWVWFKPTNFTSNWCMLGKAGDTNNWEYVIRVQQTSGVLAFLVSGTGSSGAINTLTTANGATAGAWNLAICWHDPTANKIYAQLNNSTVAEAAHTTGIFDGNSAFYVGLQQFGNLKYLGGIDEVGIKKGSLLTAADRTSLWNGGAGVTHPF